MDRDQACATQAFTGGTIESHQAPVPLRWPDNEQLAIMSGRQLPEQIKLIESQASSSSVKEPIGEEAESSSVSIVLSRANYVRSQAWRKDFDGRASASALQERVGLVCENMGIGGMHASLDVPPHIRRAPALLEKAKEATKFYTIDSDDVEPRLVGGYYTHPRLNLVDHAGKRPPEQTIKFQPLSSCRRPAVAVRGGDGDADGDSVPDTGSWALKLHVSNLPPTISLLVCRRELYALFASALGNGEVKRIKVFACPGGELRGDAMIKLATKQGLLNAINRGGWNLHGYTLMVTQPQAIRVWDCRQYELSPWPVHNTALRLSKASATDDIRKPSDVPDSQLPESPERSDRQSWIGRRFLVRPQKLGTSLQSTRSEKGMLCVPNHQRRRHVHSRRYKDELDSQLHHEMS